MNNFMSMKVHECLANLIRYQASHCKRHRLKLTRGQVLLQVAPGHIFHYDAVHVLTDELLFESDYIRAVFAL